MPRTYESTIRAETAIRNRQRIIAAAHHLFLEQGWATTTMTQVAQAAGLARPTTYLHFQSKLDLLTACIDASLSDIPVRDRSDYQQMGSGQFHERVETAGRWLRHAHERSAAIQRVLDQAAASSSEATAVLARMEQRRHGEFAHACGLVVGDPDPPKALIDEAWAIGSRSVWFALAGQGWTPEDWEAWFIDAIAHAAGRHDLSGVTAGPPARPTPGTTTDK